MNNLGVAQVKVLLSDQGSIPNITNQSTKYNFDISAYDYELMQNSPIFHPFLMENVKDPMGTFAACFPSKRKYYIDNYVVIEDSDSAPPPALGLKAIENKTCDGFIKENMGKFDEYTLIQPGKYVDGDFTYIGPKWENRERPAEAPPQDAEYIKNFSKALGVDTSGSVFPPNKTGNLKYLFQAATRDGLMWSLETDAFLTKNMPFWVLINNEASPPTLKHETFFVISIGGSKLEDRYDIVLFKNKKPVIIDYYMGGSGKTPSNQMEFDVDLSRLLSTESNIEIGVMTIAGRLVVFVNKIPMIYNRIDKQEGEEGGKLKECVIVEGKIRISGTNVKAGITVCPMTFAPFAAIALPLPAFISSGSTQTQITYKGVNNQGDPSGSIAQLPTVNGDKIFGVDCKKFSSPGGSSSPKGLGFHGQGEIKMDTGNSESSSQVPSSTYILTMQPQETLDAAENAIPNGGTPYFFRLKGIYRIVGGGGGGGKDVSRFVISVSESASTSDYFSVKRNATVVLYNKGGEFDGLKNKQAGVQISWGWNSPERQTFTGVVISAKTSEVPGKETIELSCEDYMYILRKTPIVNSPFYDGMIAYYAIKDLAERAGILSFRKNWFENGDYYLPAGYAFSKPAVRFPGKQSIFECMMYMVKRFEAFIFFDGYGALNVSKLPGGLFSESDGSSVAADFFKDPAAGRNTIVGEKGSEYNFDSTVNVISVLTVDRDTRNTIVFNKTNSDGTIPFRKVAFIDQPAYGELGVAKDHVEELSKRVFKPIRKISFKTPGQISVADVFDFITVDGEKFRLTGCSRSYDAATNDFLSEFNAEWLGG